MCRCCWCDVCQGTTIHPRAEPQPGTRRATYPPRLSSSPLESPSPSALLLVTPPSSASLLASRPWPVSSRLAPRPSPLVPPSPRPSLPSLISPPPSPPHPLAPQDRDGCGLEERALKFTRSERHSQWLHRERTLLLACNHPFIPRLHAASDFFLLTQEAITPSQAALHTPSPPPHPSATGISHSFCPHLVGGRCTLT